MASDDSFDDIPGTTLFDAQRSRQGYHLNMFAMSLMSAENRAAFKADERAYLAKFPMTDDQRAAVLARDWNRMLELGGNIYYTSKIGATDGLSFQALAAKMTGATPESYAAMMASGGRSIEGNRSRSEHPATPPCDDDTYSQSRAGTRKSASKTGVAAVDDPATDANGESRG